MAISRIDLRRHLIRSCIACVAMCGILGASAADAKFATWDKDSLTLDNGVVSRKISINADQHSFFTTELKLAGNKFNHVGLRSDERDKPVGDIEDKDRPTSGEGSDEFAFEINDKLYTGHSLWQIKSIEPANGTHEGAGAAVTLTSTAPGLSGVELKIDCGIL